MLQYIIEPAYTNNEKVSMYKDGELERYNVISYWEVEGYCKALESMGYVRAYDVDFYRKEYELCLESLNLAKEELDRAMANPLIKKN